MRVFYACMILFFLLACTSRPVAPSRSSRHTIDTLFNKRIVILQREMDSICAEIRKENYQPAVDSIMNLRKSEMNILVE